MSAIPPQVVQVACPACRTPLRAHIYTLVDVGRQPELKGALLAGRLNVVPCTNCGNVSMLATPLIYHDPAKQLFLVHFPQQLNARPDEQERFIGDATSMLMRSLPADMPKGYLLAPRRFLTLNSLIEAVLEADGVSREMLEAQRQRVDLIEQFAEAYEQGEEQLRTLVDQHRDALNDELFATLGAFVRASTQGGRDESSALLTGLLDKLLELTGRSGEEFGEEETEVAIDELLDQVLAAPDDQLEALVAELRPVIDYGFFEALTERIDAAAQGGDKAEAERLTARRAAILEMVERLDQEAQELFESGAQLLRAALEAADPAEALRAQREEIGEAFLLVLDANRAAAERAGQTEIVERLDAIRKLAIEIAQESLSPEEQFINQLLQTETPQEATQLLRQHPAIITTPFVRRLNELADESEKAGRKPTGERLRQLAREASAMLF